jgi:hypothetical protein
MSGNAHDCLMQVFAAPQEASGIFEDVTGGFLRRTGRAALSGADFAGRPAPQRFAARVAGLKA